MNQMTSQFFRV